MIKRNFKDISLSCLGMGNMRLPVHSDKPDTPIDYEKAQEIIDYAMEQGINYYDTAYVYHSGESEKFLGKAMEKYNRDSFYLATKFLYHANPDYKAVFKEQLERLQTDYIDFYLIHAVSDNVYENYINCGCIEYFLEQQRAGKIKYLGFSAHASVKVLEKFASHHQWDFAQIQLNYFDWLYGSAKAEYEVLCEKNIPIMVMEPVRGGRLAALSSQADALLQEKQPEWSDSAWAFRWLKSLPQVQVILSGMSTLEQIQENIQVFSDERAVTKEEEKVLFEACRAFRNQVQVPCTSCRYCTDGCPANINIPKLLSIYNRYKVDGKWALQEIDRIDSKGKPEDCLDCKACVAHCPQGISIPEMMKEMAELRR